ncbi:MAG: hypothetical protein ACYDC1_11955 [Limisphaerales bacterium]
MNIHTPSIPRHLAITEAMWEDLIWRPDMAAKVLLGYELDLFQSARLKIKWFTPFVIDSSGLDTGKTIVDWIHDVLRCMLIPDQLVGVFFPTGETGRNSYWTYFQSCRSPILQAHLGGLSDSEDEDGKAVTKGSACFKARFRNGSSVYLPAPSFMKGASSQASARYNMVVVEEWTHVDAEATGAGKRSGIDLQLVGRANRPCWNQHHPVWGNKLHFSAPAKTRNHPAFRRWWDYNKEANGVLRDGCLVGGCSPDTFVFSFSHKDWSNRRCHTGKSFREEYRHDRNMAKVKSGLANDAEWLGEGLGIWTSSGSGWYADEAITNAQAVGRATGLVPVISRDMDQRENPYVRGEGIEARG